MPLVSDDSLADNGPNLPLTPSAESGDGQSSACNRLMIVSDAWHPQTNGVVTTLENLTRELPKRGVTVARMTPDQFTTLPTFYPDVRAALPFGVSQKMNTFNPHAVLIMTEGPLGLIARNHCVREKIPFLTAFTTRWPEYFWRFLKFPPVPVGYRCLRWFHDPAHATLVSTPSLQAELKALQFNHVTLWSRGVDLERFAPLSLEAKQPFYPDLPRPFYLYVGRVSREKNLEAFLGLPLPGTKLLVGDGPLREPLAEQYPDALFLGPRYKDELANIYASCDVLVFPSKTDTFGVVILEALASGLPVVAYQVTGPKDVLDPQSGVGFLAKTDEAFYHAALDAWQFLKSGRITPEACREYAMRFSWPRVADMLLYQLQDIPQTANGKVQPPHRLTRQPLVGAAE